MTILVTGARGAIARNVVGQLRELGETVRAASRNPRETELPAGVEPAFIDFTKPDSLPGALSGITKVFLYAAHEGIDDFIAAAKDAGVEQFVLLSSAAVSMPDPEDNPIARMHVLAEKPLEASGVPWTFIRPAMFATNALWWRKSIMEENLVRVPYPDALVNPIHEFDMAEVAVAALTTSDHLNQAIEIDGPGVLTQREQIALIGQASGRQIEVQPLPREVAVQFMPEALLDMLATGEALPQGPTSEAVTGKPARTFAQWAVDHAGDFR